MTHLHEVKPDEEIESQADCYASEMIARHGVPGTYAQLHLLVSVAYLEGQNFELARMKAQLGGAE